MSVPVFYQSVPELTVHFCTGRCTLALTLFSALSLCRQPEMSSSRDHAGAMGPSYCVHRGYTSVTPTMARHGLRMWPPGGDLRAADGDEEEDADGVGRRIPSVPIPHHTHILLARARAPYSPPRLRNGSFAHALRQVQGLGTRAGFPYSTSPRNRNRHF